jgi:glycosyltransferase involved in cell wall biosynthesis
MRIALLSAGFRREELRLQPWLTLLEVGQGLRSAGHEVWVATDGSSDGSLPLPTRRFRSLGGTASAEVRRWVAEFAPARAVVSVSPFSLVTAGWHAALDPRTTWAFLPYGLYTARELATAARHLGSPDLWGYGRNLLMPRTLWRRRLTRRFRGVVCQSRRTASRLGTGVASCVIPPGVDLAHWAPGCSAELRGADQRPFLYVGSTRAIRGFEVLLQAMQRLPSEVRLRVLARGLDGAAEAAMGDRLASLGLAGRIEVRGGWLEPVEVRDEIRAAAAVVLPFVLVPSETPVSVMEAIACGVPVIVSDIDGLPEVAGEAGLVVPHGDPAALAEGMRLLAADAHLRQRLQRAALGRREAFCAWPEVARRWASLIEVPV